MAVIELPQMKRQLEVADGSNLYQALREAGIPIAGSCDAEGICSKCHVLITFSEGWLPKEAPLETKVKRANSVPEKQRLSCLLRIKGKVRVQTEYWGKTLD